MSKGSKKRPRGKPFRPGQSGNPKGRPPLTLEQKEFKALCKQQAPAALERIVHIATKGRGMVVFLANQYIIDRAHGRPSQEVVVSGELEVRDGRSALAKALGLEPEPGGEAPAPRPTEPGGS